LQHSIAVDEASVTILFAIIEDDNSLSSPIRNRSPCASRTVMEKGHQAQLLDLLGEVHIAVVHLEAGSMWAKIKEIVTKNNTILLR
jgi:hypothetical protein